MNPDAATRGTIDALMERHWLVFNRKRKITGCHCGFKADKDSDCGWGDSVVRHLFEIARITTAPAAS